MKPYYSDGAVTIYHGDCREILPGITADAVITDPPYNVGVAYGPGTDDTRSDYEIWCGDWFALCRSAAPITAVSPGIVNVGRWTRIAGDPDWIAAWYKPAAMGRSAVGFCNWEPVLLWGSPFPASVVDVIVAPIIPDASLDGHPCPKPLKWGTKLVAMLTTPGQTVADPFAGSGTILRAAKDLGRQSIGIEIEERYCEIAANRCAQEVLPLEGAA